MYLKKIVFIIFNINYFTFCWYFGDATEYGATNGKWEVSDLEIGACDINNIKKKIKELYNINNYTDYIKILDPDNEFKKYNNYKSSSEYFSPDSKTVALLDYKDNCGKLIELWYYKEDTKKKKTYIKGNILLITDYCKSCKNKQQVDIPFNTWNNIYEKNIYKIVNKNKINHQDILIYNGNL